MESGIAQGKGNLTPVKENGNTTDIITAIMVADEFSIDSVKEFAQKYKDLDVYSLCAELYSFLHNQVAFIEDPDGKQFILLPGQLYANRKKEYGGNGYGADCKSFSLFCSSVLRALGNYNFKYRFVSEDKADDFHHVYLVVQCAEGYIPLDCTLDTFGEEVVFEKHQDIAPHKPVGVGVSKKQKVYVGAPPTDITVESSWISFEAERADYFKKNRANIWNTLWRGIFYANVDHPIRLSVITGKLKKQLDVLEAAAFSMMYYFWDNTQAPYPTNTIALDAMYPGLAEKREFATHWYNCMIKMDARPSDIRDLCSLSCYRVYGISLDYMLYRCYNTVKYGQPWGIKPGVPYIDMAKMRWYENGSNTNTILKIQFCFPHGNGKFVGFTRPFGTPYWCEGGWVMQNGFMDGKRSDAALEKWINANPMPESLSTRTPNKELVESATAVYYQWVLGNMPGLPVVPGLTGKGENKSDRFEPGKKSDRFSGLNPYIGEPITVIVTAVVACVTAVVTISVTIAKLVKDLKTPKASQINNPPTDFKWEYQCADGGYIFRNSTGGFDKCDANGQNCKTNIDMSKPENQPGDNNFFGSGSKLKYAGMVLAALGIFAVVSSSDSPNKSSN